jgi:hypothetical protein
LSWKINCIRCQTLKNHQKNHRFLCCLIMCLYVLSSVLWCVLRFLYKMMFGLSLSLVVCKKTHVLFLHNRLWLTKWVCICKEVHKYHEIKYSLLQTQKQDQLLLCRKCPLLLIKDICNCIKGSKESLISGAVGYNYRQYQLLLSQQ